MRALYDVASYQCSQRITATYSTSFSSAVSMLSRRIRGDIHAIYGFVRLADEIVDTFHEQDQATLFQEFQVALDHALARRLSVNPILHAFQYVVHRYDIPRHLIDAFLASMRADLHKQTYADRAAYQGYIYGSAEVVGLMCLKIFVNGDQEQYERLSEAASRLGSAFQKVNFLRDYKADTEELKRSYFPHLLHEGLNARTKDAIIREIEEDFDAAYVGIRQLPIDARFGVYTAFVYYRKLLRKLKNTGPEEIKRSRIRISNTTKLRLLVLSFLNHKLNLI